MTRLRFPIRNTRICAISAPAFSGLLARFGVSLNVAVNGATERATGELVSGNYFEVLGVNPALGRVFSAEDELPRARIR